MAEREEKGAGLPVLPVHPAMGLVPRGATGPREALIENVAEAYDSLFWDETARAVLAAVASTARGGAEFPSPKEAASIASEYADALLAERQKRVGGTKPKKGSGARR